ncbi:MAG: hypothetical protein HDR01_14610 [Lachnospiraceae bacterium]|nr:hypothetical protein [Lachnospiraceae bacterium]
MKKKQIYLLISTLVFWLITFFTDTKLFTREPLNMNCLPVDQSAAGFCYIITKILVFGFIYGFLSFLLYARKRKTLWIPFVLFLLVYLAGLFVTYPGYYMNDDPIIFAYATRYYPVYWHHYLTSLFYMTGMSLFPASCGPVLLSDILYAMVYSYVVHEGYKLFQGRNRWLLGLLGIFPFVLLGALMCFRPAVYSSFFLFYVMMLIFHRKKGCQLDNKKLLLLAFLTALLSLWRSEGILLLLFAPVLLAFAYRKPSKKRLGVFFIASILCFLILKLPQSVGEDKYYGSDYLIISTTRPLSVIVHREQTYEGAGEDIENISRITEYGYLHNDSLSCSAYNRYNSDHNEGRYTQTGADKETQKAYLKSAVRLILHNLDLYIGERIQLFLVTNGFYQYDTSMVLDLKPVVATDFHLYDHDKAYGFEMLEAFKRIDWEGNDSYAMFLFRFGGEAYIPMLILAMGILIIALVRKKWFYVVLLLSLFAREAVIFLTAPASFIQYSYPFMYATAAIGMVLLVEAVEKRRTGKENR